MEELVLRYLEYKYNTVIKRQVKIGNFVLDGFMVLDSKRDAIIEVKVFRKMSASLFHITFIVFPRLIDVAKNYRTTYGRDVVVFLVFVILKKLNKLATDAAARVLRLELKFLTLMIWEPL